MDTANLASSRSPDTKLAVVFIPTANYNRRDDAMLALRDRTDAGRYEQLLCLFRELSISLKYVRYSSAGHHSIEIFQHWLGTLTVAHSLLVGHRRILGRS